MGKVTKTPLAEKHGIAANTGERSTDFYDAETPTAVARLAAILEVEKAAAKPTTSDLN